MWQDKKVSQRKQERVYCVQQIRRWGADHFTAYLANGASLLLSTFFQYYSGILAYVPEFCDKLRMSLSVTLTHVVTFPPGPASPTWALGRAPCILSSPGRMSRQQEPALDAPSPGVTPPRLWRPPPCPGNICPRASGCLGVTQVPDAQLWPRFGDHYDLVTLNTHSWPHITCSSFPQLHTWPSLLWLRRLSPRPWSPPGCRPSSLQCWLFPPSPLSIWSLSRS